MSTSPAESEAKGSDHTSLAAFGRMLHVSGTAVQKAIASGRLVASVGRDLKGRPFIANVELAKEEWGKNAGRVTRGGGSTSLAESQRKLSEERRRGLKLGNDAKRGLTIPRSVAIKEAFESARTIRDNMLNIPARLSAELAAEPDERRVYARLDEEIRKALESVARLLEELVRHKRAS